MFADNLPLNNILTVPPPSHADYIIAQTLSLKYVCVCACVCACAYVYMWVYVRVSVFTAVMCPELWYQCGLLKAPGRCVFPTYTSIGQWNIISHHCDYIILLFFSLWSVIYLYCLWIFSYSLILNTCLFVNCYLLFIGLVQGETWYYQL